MPSVGVNRYVNCSTFRMCAERSIIVRSIPRPRVHARRTNSDRRAFPLHIQRS